MSYTEIGLCVAVGMAFFTVSFIYARAHARSKEFANSLLSVLGCMAVELEKIRRDTGDMLKTEQGNNTLLAALVSFAERKSDLADTEEARQLADDNVDELGVFAWENDAAYLDFREGRSGLYGQRQGPG